MEGPSEIDFKVRDELRDQCKRKKIKVKKLNIIIDTIVFAAKNDSVKASECLQFTKRFLDLCKSSSLKGGDTFVLNYWKYTLMMERLGGSIGKEYDLLSVLRSFIITCQDFIEEHDSDNDASNDSSDDEPGDWRDLLSNQISSFSDIFDHLCKQTLKTTVIVI